MPNWFYFNPRLPRGRRPVVVGGEGDGQISIHASLAGGDEITDSMRYATSISIHASLAGGDYIRCNR